MDIIPQNHKNHTLQPISIDFLGRYGLPNSLREAMLRLDLGDAALVLDACLSAGIKWGKTFTVRKLNAILVDHAIHIPLALIRRALNSGVFTKQYDRQKKRGRPEAVYTMPEILPLVNHYAQGVWSPTDVLDPLDYQSLKLYREALHREFIHRRPGNYSRAFLARRLGVGKRTTRNYDRAAGVVAEERFSERRIDQHFNWQDLVNAARKGREWIRVKWADGRVKDMPLRIGIVWKFIREAAIYIVTQITNSYSLPDEAYDARPRAVAY